MSNWKKSISRMRFLVCSYLMEVKPTYETAPSFFFGRGYYITNENKRDSYIYWSLFKTNKNLKLYFNCVFSWYTRRSIFGPIYDLLEENVPNSVESSSRPLMFHTKCGWSTPTLPKVTIPKCINLLYWLHPSVDIANFFKFRTMAWEVLMAHVLWRGPSLFS